MPWASESFTRSSGQPSPTRLATQTRYAMFRIRCKRTTKTFRRGGKHRPKHSRTPDVSRLATLDAGRRFRARLDHLLCHLNGERRPVHNSFAFPGVLSSI